MNKNLKTVHIVLTGGGTAGHVVPHLALLPLMKEKSWNITYIGSNGIEKELIKNEHIAYKTISVGKLRRYFSFQNLLDIFRLIKGFFTSVLLLMRLRPNLVFSKGGFVSVPVCAAAWLLQIPVITHESDYTPGLANKIILKFAKKIFYSFPETSKFLPKEKSLLSGTPIRELLFTGKKELGLDLCGFKENDNRPIVLVMGGSLGAQKINSALEKDLPNILEKYRIIHLTGKGKKIDFTGDGYVSFEYVNEEIKDIFALSDAIISRAGANSIFEFLALNKPMLLIPLEAGSRGDQLINARSFEKKGWANILKESDLENTKLSDEINKLFKNKEKIKAAQNNFEIKDAKLKIMENLIFFADKS